MHIVSLHRIWLIKRPWVQINPYIEEMKFGKTIYLDYNSTTPVDPQVIEAMTPYFYEHPGNAASKGHVMGWFAEDAVENTRKIVAKTLHAEPAEIIFTSGATESINLALKGVADRYKVKGKHLITVKTEHSAVLDTCTYLAKIGYEVTFLPVNHLGQIDLEELRNAIREDTILVSVMFANNETGLIHPIAEIGKICHDCNVLFFCDATQAVGKVEIDVHEMGVHLLAFSSHKIYGSKGVGVLYRRQTAPRIQLTPLFHGGGHEWDLRSGTLNVPGIVGLGTAITIANQRMKQEEERLGQLRDYLERNLIDQIEGVEINGDVQKRLSHVSNLRFLHIDGEALMTKMGPSIALSSGSACTSASAAPSHVLLAMGLTDREAKSSIRFSLGRFVEKEEIEEVISKVTSAVQSLRSISPVWDMYKAGMLP